MAKIPSELGNYQHGPGRTSAPLFAGALFAALALVAAPSFAAPPKAPSLEKLGRLRLELAPTAVTLGLRGIVEDGALVFWSCSEGEVLKMCGALPPGPPGGQPSSLVLRVPLERRWLDGPLEIHAETLREGALLHLVVGGAERSYHLVIVPGLQKDFAAREPAGPRPRVDRSAPAVALKGALAKEEHELSRTSQGDFEFVRRARACGREDDALVVVESHRIGLSQQAFVEASDLPLPTATKPEPRELAAGPRENIGLGLAVEAGLGSSDLARDAWGFGLGENTAEAQVFSFLAPAESLVRLKVSGPSGPLWLHSKAGTFRMQLGESDAPEREVRLPGRAGDEVECVTLHAEAPAAIVGVSLVAEKLEDLRPAELVQKLGNESSRNYELALLANAAEASRALTKDYASLSEKGRQRAFRVIQNLPDKLDVEPLLAVLIAADARAPEVQEHLEKFDAAVLGPLLDKWFLQSSPRDEVKVAEAYASLDPGRAVAAILGRLGQLGDVRGKHGKVVRARRASLRAVIAHTLSHLGDERAPLASREHAIELVERLLASSDLSPGGRVELLRALPDSLGSEAILAAFVKSSDQFPSSYVLLAPRLLRFARLSKAGQEHLTSGGSPAVPFARLESAAYDSKLFELLMELELPEGTEAFFHARLELALESPERRVRERAAQVFANKPLSFALNEGGRKKLLQSSYDDPWLEVRAAAVVALGRQLGQLPSAPDKEPTEVKLGKLARKSKDPTLARAFTKALGASGGRAARDLLLQILDSQDALYEARTEAADSLGRLCEPRALASLERYALTLGTKPTAAGQVDLGLASVRALRRISPADAEARLRPLVSTTVPGPIRGQVAVLLEGPSCGGSRAGSP